MGREEPMKYYIIRGDMLPEVFRKVAMLRELLQTGQCRTVGEAAAQVGISRSAYYKYKDAVMPFQDLRQGRIVTFQIQLRDQPGLLSSVLSVFARCGANILTINQTIPVNGWASITISAETGGMTEDPETLLHLLVASEGVLKAEVLAG